MNIINFYNKIKYWTLPLIVFASIFTGLTLISLRQTNSTFPYKNYSYPGQPDSSTKAATLQCYRKVERINDTLSYLDFNTYIVSSNVDKDFKALNLCINDLSVPVFKDSEKQKLLQIEKGIVLAKNHSITNIDVDILEEDIRHFIFNVGFVLLKYNEFNAGFWLSFIFYFIENFLIMFTISLILFSVINFYSNKKIL